MLQRITINNLALIDDLEIEFSGELNVFSGETGAGKSIIVDSLMLLIGARYDKTMLKYGADKGFVEGVFSCENFAPLEALGIESDELMIVTRKFFKDGRNEIRVNGKQITVSMLRELMQSYVDIYGQNEYQSLLKINEQRKILDYFVFKKDDAPLGSHKALFDEYKRVCVEMNSLGDERERAQRIDILQYQIDEIEQAKVKKGEEETLLDRRHLLMASERIKNGLAECINSLDGEVGAVSGISDASHKLASVSSYSDGLAELYSRLNSVAIELDDINECVKDELEKFDSSERELDEVLARLDKLRTLKNKYGPFDSMNEFLRSAKLELPRLLNGADEYDKLSKRKSTLESELIASCKKLSELRKAGAGELAARIVTELADLGMANSRFEVRFTEPETGKELQAVTANGYDVYEFYLSPNKGQPMLQLAKIISGGEMSRFMLAVKLITGDLGGIGTMIFDEIDTGISGAVGLGVAKKLCSLSRGRQVLCVTHLPQIAAMADTHFYIVKSDDGGATHTHVTLLDRKGQIGEVARLSGGLGVSGTAEKNAEEMKDWADKYKLSNA